MGAFGLVLMLVGIVVAAIGGIMILIQAFRTSVLWGLGTLFVPLVGLIFVFMHWQETKKAFLINVIGTAVMILGIVLGGVGAKSAADASAERARKTQEAIDRGGS